MENLRRDNPESEILAYLDKQLTAEAYAAFTTRIDQDPDLKDRVETIRSLRLYFQNPTFFDNKNADLTSKTTHTDALSAEAQQVLTELKADHPLKPDLSFDLDEFLDKPPRPSYKWYAFAAIIVLLVGIAGFWYNHAQQQREQLRTLSHQARRAVEINLQMRNNDALYPALTSYRLHNYEQAAAQSQSILNNAMLDNEEAFLMLGASLYLQKKPDPELAATALQKVRFSQRLPLAAAAQYYLALIQLDAGNTDSVRVFVAEAQRQVPSLREEANRLLMDLKAMGIE